MKALLFIAVLILSLSTHAGVVNGGGGKGVVCRNADGSVKSVELLDFWEAKALYSRSPEALGSTLQEQIDAGLSRLKESYRFRGWGQVVDENGVKKELADQEFFAEILRSNAAIFTKFDSDRIVRLRNVILEQTNDAYEVARPRNCEFEQIVNYQTSGQILINQDLFEAMDQVNQAGLLVHEAYYQTLVALANETNSIRVRRAIGFVFHGENRFTLPPAVADKMLYTCRSKTEGSPFNSISLYDTGKTPDGLEAFAVVFNSLSGSGSLIGISSHASHSRAATGAYGRLIKQGKCSGRSDLSNSHGFSFNGPVEFDRLATVNWRCGGGKLSVFLETTLPGIGKQPT